jgi:hypothetical protein
MQNNDPLADPSSGRGTMPDEQGKFTIGGVPPGDYTIYAHTVLVPQNATHDGVQRQLTDAQRMWGRVRVSARGERTVSVNVTLQPSRSISGVVVFDMKTPPDLTRSQWTVNAVNPPMTQNYYRSGGQPNAVVKPDGRFTLTGVPAGQYMLRASSGTMKSSLVSGQETLDFPLEFTGDRDVTDAVLTVADRANNLNGTLTDASGAPAPNYTVVVAATDTRFWTPGSRRIRFSYPDFNGRYSFYDLPPGSYQLAVVTDVEPGKHYDPEFLRTIAITSVPITIADGAKVTQNLRVK